MTVRYTIPLLLAAACAKSDAPPDETARIEGLLRAVAASDATFIRNGDDHTGAAAAAHLRRKWEHAGGRVTTAEEFIEHLASRSSLSGRPYTVRLKDGTVMETSAWLRKRLREQG